MRFLSRTIAMSAAVLFFTTPSTVSAAYVSIHGGGSIVTMVADVAADTLTITQVGGLFRHNRFTAGDPGFASDFDFDTINAGDQTLPSATGIINIFAGDGNDTITIGDGINLRGLIDGQVGNDTLDYSAFTTAVRANLGLGTTGLGATLGADQENPPTTHTATATATVSNYSVIARTFDITVTVTGLLPADVTGFHIHQGAVGVNGPIIVDFTGVAPLVPAGTGFTFTATGLVLPAANEAALLGGGTYVNIHTDAFPSGAIRGQLFSAGNVNLATGMATGTNSIQNIENVTGGVGNDSLVGSSAINTINGGAGADWIVGGPGNDTLNGEAGADVLVWSNGDGSDIDEGGADSDTVQVNGSTAAADIFLVSPNGVRLRFDRTNLGLFNLDVGTVETLTVNGIGGDDAFTVNNLTGVTSLATVNLYGFEGNDGFTFVPSTADALVFNAHGGPGTDTLQGPNFASAWNLTGANQGNIAGLVTTFSFIETLAGGNASDTFNVKGFATGTATTVTGGAGTDVLNYDAQSRAVSGDTTPPDGVIDSTGVQSVIFTQIETVNIINPQPTVTINDVTVSEGLAPTNAVFTVTLSGASGLTVTVNYATADGTAAAPGDYTSQTNTVTFIPGDTSETISVPINGDALAEAVETFVVNLTGGSNVVIADAQGQGSITDNPAPTISAIANQTIAEDTATAALPFTVNDTETPAANLTLLGSSSDTTLVPNVNIVFGGSGMNRTVTVTPAANANGSAVITVTVSDGFVSTQRTFDLTVTGVNDGPTISDIGNQAIAEDTPTGALGFVVGDIDTAPASLTVTGSSSDTTLVPNANIVFGGAGANRTVTVTPAPNANGGPLTITVSVSDGTDSASDSFTLTITAVNDTPTITADIADQVVDEDVATSALAFTIADVETAAASLTLSGTSSNTALVPNANIAFGGSGENRTVTITPAANQNGSATITVTVGDGTTTAVDTFTLTVNAVNDAPTISDVANQTIDEDTATSSIAFVVGDIETVPANLTVSGTSSNTTLVPSANVVFGGSGANRTVTVTPVANGSGAATITVTVGDGTTTTADTFTLTVNAVNDAPTISGLSNQTIALGSSTGALPITVGDLESAPADLTLSGSSTNTTLVPTANIVFAGSGASRSVTITPLAGQSGSATITVTVSDGALTATTTMTLTVTPSTAPTITGSSSASLEENTTTTIGLTVGDDLTALAGLSVSAIASNTTLFPAGSLTVSGTTASRTLTLAPAADREGTSTITVTVSDGELTASHAIAVTVTRAPVPGAPSTLAASSADTEVFLSWRAPATGATPTYYIVEVGTTAGSSTLPVINTRSRATTYTMTLPPGGYFARVRAGNSSGISAVSNEVTVGVASNRNLPGTPLGLTANIRGAHVTVAWHRPVSGGPVNGWRIEVASPTGPRSLDFPLEVQSVNADLAPGTYAVRVRGLNAFGQGPASNEVAFVVSPDPTCTGARPEPPALLPATVTGHLATAVWLAPQNATVTSYRLIGGTTPGSSEFVLDVGAVQSASATLPPGRYFLAVAAMNGCGMSDPSNTIEVRVGLEREAPPSPPVVRASVIGRQVTLQWDAVPGATSYVIEAGSGTGLTNIVVYPLASTGIVVGNVPSGTYYVRVRSVGPAGTSSAPSHEFVIVMP